MSWTSPLLEMVESDAFAEAVTGRAGEPSAARIANIASEARLGLKLLARPPAGPLRPGQRVLEVGAGCGLLSSILREQGINVTALEPFIAGFTFFNAIRDELAYQAIDHLVPLDQRMAQDLDPAKDGLFDVIFSINVIEHCKPLDEALAGMYRVLAPGGVMIHTCPNYRVPYEPHYQMPLIPIRPQATARFRRGLRDEPLWQSLNFVTARDLRTFARRHGLTVRFMPGVLGDLLARLDTDQAFANRQGWAGRVAHALGRVGVLGAVNRLPPTWLTPMVTVFEKPAA
jgi:SAM-dependent methyltransferase